MGQAIDPFGKANKSDCIICHMRLLNLLGSEWLEYGNNTNTRYIIIIAWPFSELYKHFFEANEPVLIAAHVAYAIFPLEYLIWRAEKKPRISTCCRLNNK